MRTFTTNDLNKQVGDVTDAAGKGPVLITRHRKPRYVLMSVEHYESLRKRPDPRRAFGAGESPPDIAAMFLAEAERLARGEGYDDEP